MQVAIEEPGPVEKTVAGWLVKALLFRRRRDRVRHMPGHLGARPFEVRGNSGARIRGHLHPAPHGHPKGVVLLAHPDKRYAQYWFVREGWIDWLHGNGYSAVTFDFARYGASRGGSTYLHDDLIAVARRAHTTHPGVPVHVIGLSIGAFAAANAAPRLPFVASVTLESPYPNFVDWYANAGAPRHVQAANRLFQVLFPRSAARIHAPRQLARAHGRVLVVAMHGDTVTPVRLSRSVAGSGPDGTRYLELDGPAHLDAFRVHPAYRLALLDHLAGRVVGAPAPRDPHPTDAPMAAMAAAPTAAGTA